MSKASPPRTYTAVEGGSSPSRRSTSTLPRSRSSTLRRKKDLSQDEGSALNDMHRKADKQYEDEKRRESEAMRYWEEKKREEQEKFSDEETDALLSRSRVGGDGDSDIRSYSSRLKNKRSSSDKSDRDRDLSSQSSGSGISNGLEVVKVWQERFHDVESKYKDSMVANAQLYNEKTALVFQVEVLKDRLEDNDQDTVDLRAELQREQSQVLQLRHQNEALENEIDLLKKQLTFRDEFIESQGLHLPTGEDDDVQAGPQLEPEEKEKLLKEIQELKDEIASMKSGSLLGDQQPKDILQVSTRMVSEYKTKLQIAEAENARLEGLTNRLQNQAARYKNQVKELEEREDQLMKEKRHQAKEIRSLQSEVEDQRTEIDLLKRRIEGLKKRRDYGSDS